MSGRHVPEWCALQCAAGDLQAARETALAAVSQRAGAVECAADDLQGKVGEVATEPFGFSDDGSEPAPRVCEVFLSGCVCDVLFEALQVRLCPADLELTFFLV